MKMDLSQLSVRTNTRNLSSHDFVSFANLIATSILKAVDRAKGRLTLPFVDAHELNRSVDSKLSRARGVVGVRLLVAGILLATCVALPELVSGGSVAHAQNTNATIRGQVLDPSGALVPSATVLIVNKDTGVTVFKGHADSAGTFVAPQVIPGTYKITVTSPGLKQAVIDNLVATVAQVASVNINMQLGQMSETVTVESKGEELDRSTSDVSTLISPQDVQNLPLQQRTTENLLTFIPGVTHGGAGDQPNTAQLSINGSRTLNTEVLLNGVSTIVASTGTPAALPSPDGVDSFRVITTNASAEYGRTSGAVISVNTISGTNAYHGNLYFLMRNEALDANQYFHKDTIIATTGAVTPRNRERFFQEGGSVGGPVRIPHLYNGHDRTFFFVNYDRTITPSSTLTTETVPTSVQRTGDLSNASAPFDANGNPRKPQTIYQPTGKSSPAFTGNQVGPIDPAAAKILALLPLPNTDGIYDPVNNRYTGNWTSLQNLTGHVVKFVARVDEVVTPKDRMSFNVYRFTTSTPNPIYYNSQLLNTTWDCTCNNAWISSVDYTRTWTSTLVMDLNMGFFRNVVLRNPPGAVGNVSETVGIASLPLNQMPELTDPGFSNIGSDTNTDQVNITNTYTPFGTITKTVGPHTFKVGGSLRKNEFNSYNPATSPEGSIAFDGSITNHGASGNANTGIADFLLGKIKTANYEQPQPETGRRNYNFGIFAQDDWRVTPKLTFNLGIRYEYEAPLTIATDIYSRIDPATGKLLVAGNGASRSLNINTPKADISPRIGLAYSVDSKTVIRAAFCTFYGTIFQNLGGQLAYPGFDNTITYNNLGTAVAQPFSLSQGLPLAPPPNLQDPAAALANSSASNPYSVAISFNNQSHMPLVEQWNLGVERRLPLALTLEVNYVGNHALHLSYNIGENQVPFTSVPAVTLANSSLATQNALAFTNLKAFAVNDNIGSSNYNALQVSVRRDFNKRIAVMANYTYGKSEDDGSTIYNFSAPHGTANSQYAVDSPYRIKDFTVSDIDVKHTLNIAMIYTTPGPWWLRDWHISPVFVGHTGLPLNITQTNEIPGSAQRPNGNPQLVKLAHPTLNGAALQYFDSPQTDPNFPLTPSGPVYNTISGVRTQIVTTGFGNVPRDSNRAPGEVDVDASVAKDFRIYRALKFQFRIDAFNVINHTNFLAPSTSLSVTEVGTTATFATSSGFGKITGTQQNRTMQASARFFF